MRQIKLIIVIISITILFTSTVTANDPARAVREAVKLINNNLENNSIIVNDIRIAPPIRTETTTEIPVEWSLMSTQNNLPSIFTAIEQTKENNQINVVNGINIAASAQKSETNDTYLSVTLSMVSIQTDEEKSAVQKRSYKPSINKMLSVTTFNPLVRGSILSKEGTWLTNYRMDLDNRLQMTGWASDIKQINKLCSALEKSEKFSDVWISNISRNTYEKKVVFRFDITARKAK